MPAALPATARRYIQILELKQQCGCLPVLGAMPNLRSLEVSSDRLCPRRIRLGQHRRPHRPAGGCLAPDPLQSSPQTLFCRGSSQPNGGKSPVPVSAYVRQRLECLMLVQDLSIVVASERMPAALAWLARLTGLRCAVSACRACSLKVAHLPVLRTLVLLDIVLRPRSWRCFALKVPLPHRGQCRMTCQCILCPANCVNANPLCPLLSSEQISAASCRRMCLYSQVFMHCLTRPA